MSIYIRRYSRYLTERALSYRLVAVDFTKMKRGWDICSAGEIFQNKTNGGIWNDSRWRCTVVVTGHTFQFHLCVTSHHQYVLHRTDGVMRTMSIEKLMKTLPIIQNQLDALLDFEVQNTISTSKIEHVWIKQIECMIFISIIAGVIMTKEKSDYYLLPSVSHLLFLFCSFTRYIEKGCNFSHFPW